MSDNKEPTLSDYISKNVDLLTVAGIYAALTLFADDAVPGILGAGLSFLFLSGFVLLWLELWGRFPSERGSGRLTWFEDTIIYSGLILVVYWFLQLGAYSVAMLQFALALFLSSLVLVPLSRRIKKDKAFNRLFKTKDGEMEFLRYVVSLFLVFCVFAPMLILSDLVFSSYLESFRELLLDLSIV